MKSRPVIGRSGKVLVVDDSTTVRMQVRAALSAAGYDVAEAVNGLDALAQLEAVGAGFIAAICDVSMPGMTGIELLERVHGSAAAVPTLMLTTEGDPELLRRAKAAGAQGWLVKPFKADVLVASISHVLDAVAKRAAATAPAPPAEGPCV